MYRCATVGWSIVRLVIATCSVDYDGRLTAHLPMATRVLMIKADGSVLAGRLPGRALAIVRQWRVEHAVELAQNWAWAQALQPLMRIPGADND